MRTNVFDLGVAFYHFFKRRASFAKHLASLNASLTPGRYFRLMAMCLVEMLWTILVITCTLSYNYSGGLRPWTNWDDVHSNWSRVNRFPRLIIPPKALHWTYFLWWTTPISAFFFTVFFAFGQEAMREYSTFVQWVRQTIFRQPLRSRGSFPFGSPKGYVLVHRYYSSSLSFLFSALLPLNVPKPPRPIVITINETNSKETLSTPTSTETKVDSLTSGDSRSSSTDSVTLPSDAHSSANVVQDTIEPSSFRTSHVFAPALPHAIMTSPESPTPPPPPKARLGDENQLLPTFPYPLALNS